MADDRGGASGNVAPAVRRRAGARFLAAYALANAGGVIAFLPLLTLLLPLKVQAVAGPERLGVLTIAAIVGAIVASIANIVFGALCDREYRRYGTRRRWIVAGLCATIASYGGIAAAGSAETIVAAIALYQAAVNMLLAPLFATMADEVPDDRKGFAGGLLALGSPSGALVGASLTAAAGLGEGGRLAVLCVVIAIFVLPLTLLLRPVRAARKGGAQAAPATAWRRSHALVWLSRLMMQTASSGLSTYLLFIFQTIVTDDPRILASRIGAVTTIAGIAAIPLALFAGWVSDRVDARRPFLIGASAVAAAGLAGIAAADAWAPAVAAYGAFLIGSTVFVGLNAAYAMQILPSPDRRGRDLGLLNLTNTFPSLIGPSLAWTLATTENFTALIVTVSALALLAGLFVLPVHRNPGSAPAAA